MPQRVITASVGVAGLVVIGLGVASATVWKADDVLVATAPAGNAVVTTAPGVLELGGDPVTVRATTAGGAPVVLAVGRENDVQAWVGTDAHDEITGLSGWHDLAVEPVEAGGPAPSSSASPATPSAKPEAASSPAPSASDAASDASGDAKVADPTDSDLWVAQATGKGRAQLVWPAQAGRWSLIAVGTGGAAPVLEMSWPRVVTTPWLWPLVILGSLMVLVAAALLGRDLYRRRTGTQDPEWHDVTTGTIAVVGEDGAPLTRRQLREAELARSGRPRTGSVPRVDAPVGAAPDGREPAPASADVGTGQGSDAGRGRPGSTDAAQAGQDQSAAAGAQAPAAGPTTTPTAPTNAPATAPTAAIPTTRRALRTGAVPVVPAAAPARRDEAARSAQGPGAPAVPSAPQGGTEAPRRTVSAPGWLSGAGRRGAGTPADAPAAPPSDLASAQTAAIPQPPTGWSPVPSASRGAAGDTDDRSTSAQRPVGPGGASPTSDAGRGAHRPAWLATGAPAGSPPAAPPRNQPAGDQPRPNEQSPTQQSPNQQGPGSPAVSTPGQAADGPQPDAPAQAGSRADAWRRAWGLPAQPDDPPTQDDSTTEVDR